MKKCIALVLVLLALVCCAAADEPTEYTCGDFEYILLEDGTARISGFEGKGPALVIPDALDGHRVSGIEENVFKIRHHITNITIPDGLLDLDVNPFASCGKLTAIHVSDSHPTLAVIDGILFNTEEKRLIYYPATLTAESYTVPDGVTAIGAGAFRGCNSLTSLILPDSVTQIGANPFRNCKNLDEVLVSPDSPSLVIIDGVLFDKAEGRLICALNTFDAADYTVPDGIQVIGDYAFYNCDSLVRFVLPDSVISIGKHAFDSCGKLTSITLPDSMTSIGDSAFSYCISLASITLPDGVTSIGKYTFQRCSSLTSITLPDSVTSINVGTFSYCHSLASITLPDSLMSIGNYAFDSCSSLTSITLPGGLVSMGHGAFQGCSSLASITLPDSVTRMGNNPFKECTSLTGFQVSPGHPKLSVVGGVLFDKTEKRLICYPCGLRASYYIVPDGTCSIGAFAFGGVTALTGVWLPDGLVEIGDDAFQWCDSLTDITIPDSVVSMGRYAFYDCKALTKVVLPSGISSIAYGMFYGCSSLESLSIPRGVVKIEEDAFRGCDKLMEFYVSPNHPIFATIDGVLFDKTTKTLIRYPAARGASAYAVPNGIRSIGGYAFENCDLLTSITLPDSITSVGGYAFKSCGALTSINMLAGVTAIGAYAFSSCSDELFVTVPSGSYAAFWCEDNGVKFTYPDANNWLLN